ncbi:hypothetical protein BS78_06G223200 [Paspalum vaginatum]|nr:hypothetical protein BS78_06G223200 [Paspalum vaginatum]
MPRSRPAPESREIRESDGRLTPGTARLLLPALAVVSCSAVGSFPPSSSLAENSVRSSLHMQIPCRIRRCILKSTEVEFLIFGHTRVVLSVVCAKKKKTFCWWTIIFTWDPFRYKMQYLTICLSKKLCKLTLVVIYFVTEHSLSITCSSSICTSLYK